LFMNLKISQSSLSNVLIGIECVCMYSYDVSAHTMAEIGTKSI
jgi:hypothetical protein